MPKPSPVWALYALSWSPIHGVTQTAKIFSSAVRTRSCRPSPKGPMRGAHADDGAAQLAADGGAPIDDGRMRAREEAALEATRAGTLETVVTDMDGPTTFFAGRTVGRPGNRGHSWKISYKPEGVSAHIAPGGICLTCATRRCTHKRDSQRGGVVIMGWPAPLRAIH
jgi:hypothetical protein